MKFISWNVNGLRACVQKGFEDSLVKQNVLIIEKDSQLNNIRKVVNK